MIITGSSDERALFDLCLNYDPKNGGDSWNAIRQWLNSNKDDSARIKAAANYQDDFLKMTPVHLMVQKRPPLDVVQMIVKHAPESLRLTDRNAGAVALHLACFNRASLEVVKALAEAYPASLLAAGTRGCLPLHTACAPTSDRRNLEVISFVADAYPEAIEIRNKSGKRPSDLLKQPIQPYIKTEASSEMDKYFSLFSLRDAVICGHSVYLLQLLIEAFPGSVTAQDADGMTAAHHACKSENVESVIFFAESSSCMKSWATITDSQGRTAQQAFQDSIAVKDDMGRLLIHRQAANGITAASLNFLATSYPEGITHPDRFGMLPFHYACLTQKTTVDALMLFIQLYPGNLIIK